MAPRLLNRAPKPASIRPVSDSTRPKGPHRIVGQTAPSFVGLRPSSERASRNARAIKKRDTEAEVALRRALWAVGLRYRKDVGRLPGRPDLVFARWRLAVFVDGDFWHGRDWDLRRRKLA